MSRIKSIRIEGHPALGNLDLDFCGTDGRAVDTVILAGENGVGKSTVMGLLYGLISGRAGKPFGVATIALEEEEGATELSYTLENNGYSSMMYACNQSTGEREWVGSDSFTARHPMAAIYSDVDINFHANNLTSVTSLTLDSEKASRRSSGNLPTEINQLLIDVQALDDAEVSNAARNNPDRCIGELGVQERIPRFTSAFGMMFDDLRYDRIENRDGHKEIVFRKCGKEIPIDALSSGEKQVVYRGCFLLKDANATRGAFVFIDEPEISLHPLWQQKVLDYYKAMFTDATGAQTSQIFCVTHSPFVIHSNRRRDDKVIVMKRAADGGIEVSDKPEYYRCDSIAAVEDAFSIKNFTAEVPTVYLEGPTDEKYFRKAAEVFGYDDRLSFHWIGYNENGNPGRAKFTGSSALLKAYEFLSAHNPPKPVVFLLDCDTNKGEKTSGNVRYSTMCTYGEGKGATKGIENALCLDGVDMNSFLLRKETPAGFGKTDQHWEIDKTKLCSFICSMDNDRLKAVFANLDLEIKKIIGFFESCE